MGKRLRFGGPNLPKGRHTWAELCKDGGGYRVVFMKPGDELDAAEIHGDSKSSADYYVQAGMAEFIGSAKPKSKGTSKKAVKSTEV